MGLSRLVHTMDLSIWFQLALVIFVATWIAIVFRLFLRRSRDAAAIDQAAMLPLEDGAAINVNANRAETNTNGGHAHVHA